MKKEWPIWTKTDERIQMRDATDVYRPQPQTWRWGYPWARTSRAWPWWTRTCTCPRRTWGTITNNVQRSASTKFADLSFLWASLFSTCAIGIIITLQRSRKIEFSWFFEVSLMIYDTNCETTSFLSGIAFRNWLTTGFSKQNICVSILKGSRLVTHLRKYLKKSFTSHLM